jgi:hypothetical protein
MNAETTPLKGAPLPAATDAIEVLRAERIRTKPTNLADWPRWNRPLEIRVAATMLADPKARGIGGEFENTEATQFFVPLIRTLVNILRNLDTAGVVASPEAIADKWKQDNLGHFYDQGEKLLDELATATPEQRPRVRAALAAELQASQLDALNMMQRPVRVASDVPGGEIAPDPFQAELARALVDVRGALGTNNAKRRTPLFGVDAAHLLGEEFPDTQWLVTGLITRRGTAMIGGLPKAAKKTWLATEIAVAVATGTKVCGEFFAERGSVRYFYAEDTRRQIRNRLRALLARVDREMPVGRLHLEPRGSFIDVMRDEELAWIVASCRRGDRPDLLVLDPLSDIHSGEEDKRDSMRDVMRRLRLLGELLGCTVLAVHHAGKPSEANAKRGGGQRLRGSGSIHGSVDSGIYFLECEGDGVSTFKNTVESEVKGAQSAGIFTLELQIEDDSSGEAVRATWKVTREASARKPSARAAAAAAKAGRDAADDDKAFAFVRDLAMRGVHLTRRKLRTHDAVPLPERRLEAALNRLIEVGRLRLAGADGGEVHVPEPSQEDR